MILTARLLYQLLCGNIGDKGIQCLLLLGTRDTVLELIYLSLVILVGAAGGTGEES